MFGNNISVVEFMTYLSLPLLMLSLMVIATRDKKSSKYSKIRREGKKMRKHKIMTEYRIDADYGFTEPEVGLMFTDKDFSQLFIVTEIDKDVVTVECMSKMSKEDFMSNYKWLCPRGSTELEKGNNLDRHFYT
mgnify:CR=1 FL=1